MKTLIFDIETNGLLEEMTKCHCIAMKWYGSNQDPVIFDTDTTFQPALEMICEADRLVAHNGIGFDVPALKKLFPGLNPKGVTVDTLVLARGLWPDIILKDMGRKKKGTLPPRLVGSHSLEAYGYRLGELKGEYGKQKDAWKTYTPEMAEYCKQDVVVLEKLYDRILQASTDTMIDLECRFAEIIRAQMDHGVKFDEDAAVALMLKLRDRKEELVAELQKAFPPICKPVSGGKTFTARGKSKHYPGLEKGNKFCKFKMQEFNPGSRQQIVDRLMRKYDWEPTEYTEKGAAIVNEAVLKTLDYPEIGLLLEFLLVNKRLGQIADGSQAWLKNVKEGRIHGRVNTAGAVSGRCTHSNPNLAQVPAVRAPYGEECRRMFTVPPGYKLVGCDASGLELRCLAHYLARYDGGEYGKIVLHGDIHTANQKAAGLPERNMAKTFIYGWLYGAGPAKIGKIVNGGVEEGARLQARFMKQFPAIKKLKEAVTEAVKTRKYLKGLDGRKMKTRSEHSALNLLLQGAGALVMKRWLIEVWDEIQRRGLDATPVLNIHDEAQFEVREDQAEELAKICEECMPKAGAYFKFRIPIEGEAKIGDNWAETH